MAIMDENVVVRNAEPAPVCSVVMPVYNTKEIYFRAAIESILQQTFQHFELIIVDDCSEPYIREIVDSYHDSRIHYMRQKEQSGAAAARNAALDKARGEFIAFMDSDDISLPDRLGKQVDYLHANPDIGCLGTKFRQLKVDKLGHCPTIPMEHAAIESYLLFCGCAFCQSSVMVRRSVLEANAIRYRSEYVPAEDYALWLDLIGKTRFATLGDELVHYRIHPQGISCRISSVQMQKLALAQSRALELYGDFVFDEQNIWFRFINGVTLTTQEYLKLSSYLHKIISALYSSEIHTPEDVLPAVRSIIRKIFYRTRTLRGQWELLRLPISRLLKLPLWWRLFCFISRGIFLSSALSTHN